MNPIDAHLAAEGREMPPLRATARLAGWQKHPGGTLEAALRRMIYESALVQSFEYAAEPANGDG